MHNLNGRKFFLGLEIRVLERLACAANVAMFPHTKGSEMSQSLFHLDQLNKVPTGVIKNRHVNVASIHWLGDKFYVPFRQLLPIRIKVLNLKRKGGNVVRKNGVFVGTNGSMVAGFKQQFRSIRVFLQDNGQPTVRPQGDIVLHLEAEGSAIERFGLILVIDKTLVT